MGEFTTASAHRDLRQLTVREHDVGGVEEVVAVPALQPARRGEHHVRRRFSLGGMVTECGRGEHRVAAQPIVLRELGEI